MKGKSYKLLRVDVGHGSTRVKLKVNSVVTETSLPTDALNVNSYEPGVYFCMSKVLNEVSPLLLSKVSWSAEQFMSGSLPRTEIHS